MKLFQSPLINVSLLSIFWAMDIFVAKLAFLAGAKLFTFTIQTGMITLSILTIYILLKKLDKLKKTPRRLLFFLLLINVIGSGLGGTLANAGIQLTTAINAGFLFQFDIALTILIAWFVLREKIDLAKMLMLLFILLGTFLLVTNGQLIIPRIGDLFILLAGLCFASNTVLIRKILKHTTVDPDIASFLRPLAGLSVLLPFVAFAPLYPEQLSHQLSINLFDFSYLGYVVIDAIVIVLLFIFLNRTLKIASASYTALIASVTPILVAILGILFLHESLTPIQFVGAFFILLASSVTHFLKVDKH